MFWYSLVLTTSAYSVFKVVLPKILGVAVGVGVGLFTLLLFTGGVGGGVLLPPFKPPIFCP